MKSYETLNIFIIYFDANDFVRTSSGVFEGDDYEGNELPIIPFEN